MPPEIDKTESAKNFLGRDFSECFAQMRHYDGQLFDICKFAFTTYISIFGISVGMYKYSPMLAPASLLILHVGVWIGLVLLSLAVRNRVYYVTVTRYINEHRNFFLADKPLGFANQTGMYTDKNLPPYFNWLSSQSLFLYSIAILNSVVFGVLIYIASFKLGIALLVMLVFLFMQLTIAIVYLVTRENKNSNSAVFGKK